MINDITIEPCDKESIDTIVDGINDYNLSKVAALSDAWTPIEYVARDKTGAEVGGVLGGIGYWNGFEVKVLWVKEGHRNKGIGTAILKHAERIASDKGAEMVMLDTFDFQAEAFYLKNDYQPIGEIKDFPKGHRRIYFSKQLVR